MNNGFVLTTNNIILVIVIISIVILYLYYANYYQSREIEPFVDTPTKISNSIDKHRLKVIGTSNKVLFDSLYKISEYEKELILNDIKFIYVFKKYKLKLDSIINSSEMKKLFNNRKIYIGNIIFEYETIIQNIDTNSTGDIYDKMKQVYKLLLKIYKIQYKFYINNTYFDYNKISTDINKYKINISSTNEEIKKRQKYIGLAIQDILTILNKTSDIERSIKNNLIQLFSIDLILNKKRQIKTFVYDTIDMLITLAIIKKISKKYYNEKIIALDEARNYCKEINKYILDKQVNIIELQKYFSLESGIGKSILISENEHKYFNTLNNNDTMLNYFCKKIKKIDKPKNNTLLFKRLGAEFITKKNKQIQTLNNNITTIMEDMYKKETDDANLYTLRTNKEAEKQLNAIKIAKNNIDTAGNLKLNIT